MSGRYPQEVETALHLITDAKLTHPLGPLLYRFVVDALDPRLPARFILQRCQHDQSRQDQLLRIVSDWKYIVESLSPHGVAPPSPDAARQSAIRKRDGDMCCITGKPGRLCDPLVIVPILPVPTRWAYSEPHIHEMLGAFFTPPYRDWWLAYVENPESMIPLHNHWLVRKSSAAVFSQGLIRFDRLETSMFEYKINHVYVDRYTETLDIKGPYAVLGDHSRCGIPKVDARFLGTHARFSMSMRWIYLAEQFTLNEHPRSNTSEFRMNEVALGMFRPGLRRFLLPFSVPIFSRICSVPVRLFSSTFIAIWTKFPRKFRIATYKTLQVVGRWIFGRSAESETVQRLPFGLYLKFGRDFDALRNEFNALESVRKHTTVPVPKPVDVVPVPGVVDEDGYLLTSRLPGKPLSLCDDLMSDRDYIDFATQMQDYIAQLRSIPKNVNPNFAICNTLGEACRDTRILWGDPVGPFEDEEAFNQILRNANDPGRKGHKIVFTHADLNMRNILVDQILLPDGRKTWKVTGIVDWESSGFYPEYWDYTRSLYEGFRYTERGRELMHTIFRPFGDYSKEFDVEKRSWEEGDN